MLSIRNRSENINGPRERKFGVWSAECGVTSNAITSHFALPTPHSEVTPHSRLRTPHSAISLLEVLISIFILSIGLLSISSLLPVGSYQAQKAGIEDRKAVIGQNAVREFRTYGMANPTKWTRDAAGTAVLDGSGVPAVGYLPPLAIDPRVLSNGSPLAGTSVEFPRDGIAMNRMKRVGLSFATTQALADLIFVSRDDVVFEKQADADLPAQSTYEPKIGTALRRMAEGNFSWLATLAPAYANANGITAGNQFNLSIVIFYKRNISSANNESGVGHERQLDVNVPAGGFGLGGGEIELRGSADQCAIRPGDWLMLSKPVGPAANETLYFRWYRVVTAADYNAGGREITVAGPDWGLTLPANDPSKVSIFEGAIGVYEKTVHLEGLSLWSN